VQILFSKFMPLTVGSGNALDQDFQFFGNLPDWHSTGQLAVNPTSWRRRRVTRKESMGRAYEKFEILHGRLTTYPWSLGQMIPVFGRL
jgi:hypothetical protein